MDSKVSPNWRQWKSKESGHAPWLVAFWRGRGACWSSEMGLGRVTNINLHKTNTRWLVHNCSTFGARTSHGQTQIHKTHHGPDLGEATTFPLIVYSMLLHKAHIQMVFCPETPKWESQNCKVGTLATLGLNNFVCRPPIEMRSKTKL